MLCDRTASELRPQLVDMRFINCLWIPDAELIQLVYAFIECQQRLVVVKMRFASLASFDRFLPFNQRKVAIFLIILRNQLALNHHYTFRKHLSSWPVNLFELDLEVINSERIKTFTSHDDSSASILPKSHYTFAAEKVNYFFIVKCQKSQQNSASIYILVVV